MATRKIRLLWVFPSLKMGGAQRRFATLVGALGEDYEHAVIAMDGVYDAERMIPEGVAWRRVEVSPKKKGSVSIGAMWSFRRLLARENPDLLLTTGWSAVEWLLVNRGPGAVPHVHFEDAFEDGEAPGALNGSRSWARRRAFPGRDRTFVATCSALRDLFVQEWGAPADAVELIPNGVDTAAFSSPLRETAPREPVRIGALGALRPEKRFDRLLRMVAALRERGRAVEAMLVGEGPERGALEALAEELSIAPAVHFVGAQADISAYLDQMDVFALTSDAELAPISVVEAMAAGLPVLATAVGDVPDTISKANRMFVRPVEDESALVAAAELLTVDPIARVEIGAQNRERAQARYSLEAMVSRYDALFRSAARGGNVLMLPAPAAE